MCAAKLDAATNVSGAGRPGPGDVTVCIYCRSILEFTEGMGLRLLPQEELDQLPEDFQQFIGKVVETCLEVVPREKQFGSTDRESKLT